MLFSQANLVNLETLTPVAVFGMFAALAWWGMELLGKGKTRAIERLEEIRMPRRGQPAKKQDTFTKTLEAAAPALAAPLQPKTEAELGKLRLSLANAGFRSETAASVFLGLKFTALVIGFLMAGGTSLFLYGPTQKTLMWTIGLAGILFYLPNLVVGFIGKSRKQAIFLALPDALDLMVVCVEAGLGLDQAMRKVSEEMRKAYPILCEEFALCNFQLQMGRAKADVLHDLGVRTGVPDLRGLAAVLIQADKFGSSVAQALRVQSDALRTRRRQRAEEKAAKTAVKLIFPLVLFIFPGIFVILVGPAAVTMCRELFPKMGGK